MVLRPSCSWLWRSPVRERTTKRTLKRFLDSWAERVPRECIPAFDEMGGVWSESMGHGNYGPVAVIPWAFEAWRTATNEGSIPAVRSPWLLAGDDPMGDSSNRSLQ